MNLKNLAFYADLHLVKMRARARGENDMITELQIKFPDIFEIEFEQQLENYCKLREAYSKHFSKEELRKILSEEMNIH